jgi:hypothetical protein
MSTFVKFGNFIFRTENVQSIYSKVGVVCIELPNRIHEIYAYEKEEQYIKELHQLMTASKEKTWFRYKIERDGTASYISSHDDVNDASKRCIIEATGKLESPVDIPCLRYSDPYVELDTKYDKCFLVPTDEKNCNIIPLLCFRGTFYFVVRSELRWFSTIVDNIVRVKVVKNN